MGIFRDEDGKRGKAPRTVHVCPDCKGTNVEHGMWDGMLTFAYRCHDCGFEGMVVPELDVDGDEEGPG